uniref:Dynein heavy chain 9, axonemal n=1 Tax=Gadus morhua TaxID=8049 RepID=A0A8C5D1B4_GADMO
MDGSAPEDKRLGFLEDYVLKTLKLKPDKWQKCISTEEHRQVVQEFLDKADQITLVVSLTAAGLLVPDSTFPTSSKNKAVYFVKRSNITLTPDKMKCTVVYGDLACAPIDQFSALVEEVLVPLLSNGNNHGDWPQVVSHDVRHHVNSLKTNVFVVSGQVKGKTLLPLPAGVESVEQASLDRCPFREVADKTVIHAIETLVIEWSHQVRAVLKKDSSEALLEDRNPTPQTELLFWKNRSAPNLQCIHTQLISTKVCRMADLMEAMESSYYPAFKSLLKDVLAALEEAQDIVTHLKPLQRVFEDVENGDFPDVSRQIGPLMHTVCLVWAHSRYYNTPARLIVLLQETCNLLIQQARTFLSPEEVLKGELSETLPKVRAGLEVLQLFRETYSVSRANLSQYQRNGRTVPPWDFSPALVFSRLDRFIDRVQTVEDILLTAMDLLKLEKVEFGGVRGKGLSQQVQCLHLEFLETYKTLTEKPYDCLDLNNKVQRMAPMPMPPRWKRNGLAQTVYIPFHTRIHETNRGKKKPFVVKALTVHLPLSYALFTVRPSVHPRRCPLQLVSVLREVKYLEATQMESIPETAVQIYTTRGQLQQYITNLELISRQYNKVPFYVEYPLLQGQLKEVDVQLKRAEESLNWNSEGIWEYIQAVRDRVCDLESRLQRAKNNVEEVQKCTRSWASPIFGRREGKKEALISLEDRPERLEKFYGLVRSSGEKIHLLLKVNRELFGADPDSEEWKAYVEYMDDMVMDGFFSCIECSLKFFLDNTDERAVAGPLFEALLELRVPDMVFSPSLELGSGSGFYELVEGLVNDVYKTSALIARLAQLCYADMEDMADLTDMRQLLTERVQNVMVTCCEFRNSLDTYAYLYVDDRKEFMRHFLLYGFANSSLDAEGRSAEGLPETPPTLDSFKEQVDRYERIYEEVQALVPVCVFQGWMRVDARGLKSALLNVIKKWSFMFKQHLVDHVTSSLSDLQDFVSVTRAGLGQPVEEGDHGSLVGVMGHLLAVKEKQATADAMFEPLQQTIALLKVYEQELPDVVHKQLEELPEKWINVKKHAVAVKQQMAPMQASEVAGLRRKCASFDVEQHSFREDFRSHGPFRFDSENPYKMLDTWDQQIGEREAVMSSLVEAASLFEVSVPDYKQLRQCRREVVMLKDLWDLKTVVDSSITGWRTTPWMDIQVEDMEMQCKRYAKEIRCLDKESRAWDAFTGLDATVKDLLTSLRVVAELQNPAVRARHWRQLMDATGVQFTMNQETTLAELLQLNLHCFEEEVRGIVDKASKEMGMEKVLAELNDTWTGMQFQYESHHRTKLPLLLPDEALIETLEDNQVQLQNLMSSKYIDHFLEEVSAWQRKLSVADSVISIWFEVQRNWTHLESIFIGSEDIRSQLPEDSKRFDGIDSDFKELATDGHTTPNVVAATNKAGLFGTLEDIQTRLALCEKALAEYLDTKRLAFPRFYFISSADLLDILSNGTNPQQVSKHLSKLFDNMAKMCFEDDSEGNSTNTGLGMYSHEDEYVPFNKSCDCNGAVEAWLNRVLESMRSTVRHEMTEAVAAYEDKPREQWLFDYPAQVALTCTQIWWTSDVGIAFLRLEEGYENAMKEYYKKQVTQLNTLISMLIGQLSPGDRQKVMTICTIDVHARDVVAKMVAQKIDNSQAFVWLSQLRHRWGEKDAHCYANICDAQFQYSYEYLGNTPRLVITPLTDRCYITLTQSLHLTMSGAPAGPAGTGKTETTKDLGRALGIIVYVFNCSEQMDYKSCGNIYKGLAQTGAWGCFDEFNRITVEVLSVVAVQVKSIQDAIRDKMTRFNFMGEDVNLVASTGIFITMNPGYAGRTELPENLKALFRPCAMVVPDFELICEIMLVAEGFLEARVLARKFITLYTLCKELLSKQDHYDWGLRAIKSVLVVAGALKRGDPGRPEDQVLMRALRDFNIPKIVTDDMPVFMGLIGDLFPALDVPRKRDMDFEKSVRDSVLDLKLQAEDNFVLKVVQLEELLAVRHSVFVIGNAGTGKSQVMRSLQRTYQNMKRRPVWADLNPKAVTNDELFGIINPATREWKDGLFSNIMRELANLSHTGPKWIVLDGDIDPMWIESLNTVMDDNKVLTLASNERIPLNPTMRLVFEISHLRTATPATVSRAGILYINPADLGWNPPVSSWIDRREVQSEKANLTILFDKYLPSCLETIRTRFKQIIPVPEQSLVQTLCHLLECLLTPENTPADCAKELHELYFVFATVWAFGGAMFQDQLVDYRVEFSKWWVTEFKTVKFPSQGTVFDYYIDPETKKFEPWSKIVPKFEMDTDLPLQACLVPTTETIRVRYFMDRLLEHRRPVMLVGSAGTGKSVLVGDKLGSLDPERYTTKNVPFNYYTTSAMLQAVLEKPLEKKAGRNYGPPGSRRLVYFVDDMNMPEVDAYGTVQPHTLIRQHMDYNH